MKYVTSNNGSLYYQRAIPKALQARLGKSNFKYPLDPMQGAISKQAEELARQHSALFKAMQQDSMLTVTEQKLAAIASLATHGLKPGDASKDADIDDPNPNLQGLKPHIEGFLDSYIEKHRERKTTKDEDLAYKMLYKPLPLTLSEAIDVYFDEHERGNEDKWRQNIKHYWDLFLDHAGDIALAAVERETVKAYIRKRLAEGKKTGTVEKELSIIGAVFNKARISKSINCINPFERQSVPNAGKDAKRKLVLEKQQLSGVLKAANSVNDDIRRIVLLQAATGARIAEIVGMRLSDLSELNGITFIKIQEHSDSHGSRSLKTVSSQREIPLVPFGTKAAKSQLQDAKGVWLFPRYITTEGTVNADSAGASVNKWLKGQITGLTSHSFRHTLKTYLREVTSKAISDEITGHSSADVADSYGLGVSLKTKLDALKKAFKGVDV
jgi:integrase